MDITMTSVVRPAVLEKTLHSFCVHLFDKMSDHRLIVNIDPVSNGVDTTDDVLDVIYTYFKKENVIYNTPQEPHFGKALIWCWNQIKSDYVFHLEDDWFLTHVVNMKDLFDIHKEKDIATARLIIVKGKYMDSYKKNDAKYFSVNNKLSLNPCLCKASYIKGLVPLMNPNKNPELQVVHARPSSKIGKYSSKWRHVVLNNENNPLVENIGKDWRIELGLSRTKSDFVTWRKI